MMVRTFILPDGTEGKYDIKEEGHVVCVVAMTTDHTVILAKQFRPGPEKVLLELPGGWVNPNENIVAAASRELQEETGYVGHVEYAGPMLLSAYSTGVCHVCIATQCVQQTAQQLDRGEYIEVVTMSVPEFREHLRSGQLTDVEGGYRGLDALGLL